MSRRVLLASVAFAPAAPHPRELFEKMNLPENLRPAFRFLAYARNREDFFETILSLHLHTDEEMALIRRAYDVAEREFRDVYRKSGERYFEHLRRCVLILVLYLGVRAANMIIAMLLHDLIEMNRRTWSYDRVEAVFNAEVAYLVNALTKMARGHVLRSKHLVNVEYFDWLASADRDVIVLKAVDRLDNLLTLWAKSRRKIKHSLGETEHYLLPIFAHHGTLVFETKAVVSHIRAALHNK